MRSPLLLDVLTSTAYDRLGIVPIDATDKDYNASLADLPPDEARKMRRKFRKLWRKAVKKPKRGGSPTYLEQLGLGSEAPTKRQKIARKREVARLVRFGASEAFKALTQEVNSDTPK